MSASSFITRSRHTFVYWEGAVEVEGRGPEGELAGRGYVELTGY